VNTSLTEVDNSRKPRYIVNTKRDTPDMPDNSASSQPDEASLDQVVARALDGDRTAFTSLIRKYARLVYGQVYLILRDREETEDIVQETFIRAFQFRVRLRNPRRFSSWLLSIARNLARDVLRRRRTANAVPVPDDALLSDVTIPGPRQLLESADRRQRVKDALAGLPNRYRTALTLRYVRGLGHQAIEQRMGISNGALRGILNRGLERLRTLLRDDGVPPGLCIDRRTT